VFNVYLPCQESTIQYESEISNYVGFIESVLNSYYYTDVVIMGDTNFQCVHDNIGFRRFLPFLNDCNLICCDSLTGGANTYINSALGRATCIDHFFVSANLYNNIVTATVEDWGHNASDHRPLSIVLRLSGVNPAGVCSHIAREMLKFTAIAGTRLIYRITMLPLMNVYPIFRYLIN